jgi:hypothetical protein
VFTSSERPMCTCPLRIILGTSAGKGKLCLGCDWQRRTHPHWEGNRSSGTGKSSKKLLGSVVSSRVYRVTFFFGRQAGLEAHTVSSRHLILCHVRTLTPRPPLVTGLGASETKSPRDGSGF